MYICALFILLYRRLSNSRKLYAEMPDVNMVRAHPVA